MQLVDTNASLIGYFSFPLCQAFEESLVLSTSLWFNVRV